MSQDSTDKSAKPTGQGDWTVEPGDSMASIADLTGHFWQTIWDDPENANLKAARDNPEVLIPGDKVTIPEFREKQETRATDLVHRFKRKGVPVKIGFKAQTQDGEVFANKSYVLRVGKRRYEGKTDSDGALEHWVTPSAKTGTLMIELDTPGYPALLEKELAVGAMQPVDTVTGALDRLKNLGYGGDDVSATDAIREFQLDNELEATGELNDETRDKLEEVCGF